MCRLAIFGGSPIRTEKLPSRMQFGKDELNAVQEVFEYYKSIDSDFASQGYFEEKYCNSFVHFMGGAGHCDSVSSGTGAMFVAIQSLLHDDDLEIGITCITDPGVVSAIALLGHKIRLIDNEENSINTNLCQVKSAVTDRTKLVIITHVAGKPVEDIASIVAWLHSKNIFVVEDCSQAHGALVNNIRVGSFGDISIFSTMHSKNHSSGSSGGIIFTKSFEYYKKIRSFADRGKDFFTNEFDMKNPGTFNGPALNFNNDEISCAIGATTLKKLEQTNAKRLNILCSIQKSLDEHSKVLKIYPANNFCAPFFWPILLEVNNVTCSKIEFAKAVQAEGIGINFDYKYCVSEWIWAKQFLIEQSKKPINAINFLKQSFNLLFNERFDEKCINDIVAALLKVEKHYSK